MGCRNTWVEAFLGLRILFSRFCGRDGYSKDARSSVLLRMALCEAPSWLRARCWTRCAASYRLCGSVLRSCFQKVSLASASLHRGCLVIAHRMQRL